MIKLELPDRLYKHLRQAIADVERCETDPDYVVDMGSWHNPIKRGKKVCAVCMAGAVISRCASPETECYPSDFENDERNKLVALDKIRQGYVLLAAAHFYSVERRENPSDEVEARITRAAEMGNFDVVDYHADRHLFMHHMNKIADALEHRDI